MQVKQIQSDDRGHDRFFVLSGSGNSYVVTYEGSGDCDPEYIALWSCTCPAYKYQKRGTCKHIDAVVESLEIEVEPN